MSKRVRQFIGILFAIVAYYIVHVQDRANGTRKDFDVSPISKAKIYS